MKKSFHTPLSEGYLRRCDPGVIMDSSSCNFGMNPKPTTNQTLPTHGLKEESLTNEDLAAIVDGFLLDQDMETPELKTQVQELQTSTICPTEGRR